MLPKIRFALGFILLIMSSMSFSQDAVPCGMMVEDEGLVVEPRNGEICPEDIAFQGTYLIFADILQDRALRDIVLLFISEDTLDNPFTKFADESIGISSGFYFILSAVAVFSWTLLIPILTIKGYTYAMMVNKTGNLDFSENKGDTIKFVSYTSFMFFLILPTGFTGGVNDDRFPLMIGQSLAVVGSLPAHMGGNYIYSTYLHGTTVAATDVSIPEEMLLPVGQNISNGIIEGQLCQKRTRQALFSSNGKIGSAFFDTATLGEFFGGVEQDGIMDRVDNCLGYVGTGKRGNTFTTLESITINKRSSSSTFCSKQDLLASSLDTSFFMQAYYDVNAFGYNHTCSSVAYGIADGKFDLTWGSEEKNGDQEESIKDIIEELQQDYSTTKFYSQFKRNVLPQVKLILAKTNISPNEKVVELNRLFINEGNSLISPNLVKEAALKSGSNDQKQLKYMAVATALLGGTVEVDSFNAFLSGNLSGGTISLLPKAMFPALDVVNIVGGSIKTRQELSEGGIEGLLKFEREYSGLGQEDGIIFGYDVLVNDANDIADLIIEYQCALDWGDNIDTRIFIAKLNDASDEDEVEEYINAGAAKYSCVDFLAPDERGDTSFDRWVSYPTKDSRVFDDIDIESGSWSQNKMDDLDLLKLKLYMQEDVAGRLFDEIRARQLVLSGYTVAVKKSVADNLSIDLSKNENEADFDMNLRPKGWGVMGGALLYLGQTQSSALHMKNSLQNAISVEVGSTDTSYVSREAFGDNPGDEINESLSRLFPAMEVDQLFTIGETGVNGYIGPVPLTIEEKQSDAMGAFFIALEDIVMGPSIHIKTASGMDPDRTLEDGFRVCYDSGYDNCLSGTNHPIVALSHFGNDMMNNMLTVIMVDAVLRVVDRAIGFASNNVDSGQIEGSDKKGFVKKIWGSVKSLFTAAGGVIFKIVGAVTTTAVVVMDVIMPLVYGLFMAGAVFAFIIPMMSFLYGFMMLLLTYVGIFVTAVVFPLYAITKFLHIEKEYQQGFRKLYEDMLGPYLTPLFFTISAVLAWNLIVVVLYVLNASFTLVYQGLGASGAASGLTGLFFQVFMYVVYLVTVFILFKFSLGIMKDMPDMLKEKLNLKRGNDDQFIQSLGFEQYVNTQAMAEIAKMPSGLAKGLASHAGSGGFMKDKALKDKADQAEEFADLVRNSGGPRAFAEQLDAFTNQGRGQSNAMNNEDMVNGQPNDIERSESDENNKEQSDTPISDVPKITIEKEDDDYSNGDNLSGDSFDDNKPNNNDKPDGKQ